MLWDHHELLYKFLKIDWWVKSAFKRDRRCTTEGDFRLILRLSGNINPPLGKGKNVRGKVQKIPHLFLRGWYHPQGWSGKKLSWPPQIIFSLKWKNCVYDPPRNIFSLLEGLAPPQTPLAAPQTPLANPHGDPPSLISLNMSFVGYVTWKCILFSDLKTFEVFTIFGSENLGSVYYFRIWKPWKCTLFSDLKTVEVHTIFVSENRGSVYYFRIWKPWRSHVRRNLVGGSGRRSPWESTAVWGGAKPPNEGAWSGGMVPSRGLVKVGLIFYINLKVVRKICRCHRSS